MKRRLRWWHRKHSWIGQASWVFTWDGRVWMGRHPHCPAERLEVAANDTKRYGPFGRMRFPNGIPRQEIA